MKGERVLEGSPVEGQVDSQPRPRFWLIGLVMFGIIVVILVGAFLLNRQFRPRVGIEPAATAGAAVQAQATKAPLVASQPAVQPTVVATAVATPTAVATAAPAGAVASAKPTADPAQVKEIEQAYLRYWEVYGEAMNTLDTSKLQEVAAGDRLQQAIAEVNDLKAAGKAAKIEVEHKFFVFSVTERSAAVHDEYVNNSYAVDPKTKQPVGTPGKGEAIVDTYFLERDGGTWKVVRGVRESQ